MSDWEWRNAQFARLVEGHPIEQHVYDASDAAWQSGYQAAVEACHIINRPFTLWQGACGHVWDRAKDDTPDCPRCGLPMLPLTSGEIAFIAQHESVGYVGTIDDARLLIARLLDTLKARLSESSPKAG